ncbi:MAG: hypothetical protein V3U78_05160 [Thiotrichaceae bacterium]
MKNLLIGTVTVFIAWMAMDFLFHGNLLKGMYEESASLWRPPAEMKMGINALVVLIAAAMFTAIYVLLIANKGVGTGLLYGLFYGVAVGVGAGFGTFSFMPLPYELALSWFGIIVVESLVAGGLLGLVASRR